MKYALGNMLNGAGGLNADQLSLDLQFAADKTLTARKGPTPVLTRGSSATLVNSAGLIEYAPENLILQSENLSTTWTANQLNTTGTPPYLNVETAPSGQTTADKIIANAVSSTHQFRQSVTLVGGTAYTLSVYFKAAEQSFATFQVFGTANGSATWAAFYRVAASAPSVGTFTGFSSISIEDAGNGWRRCIANFTTTASGTLSVRIGSATGTLLGNDTFVGDNTSGIFIWGAQLESGPIKTYNPTTTAAFYGPRFDHDPVTLASRGLLIEEGRTNLLIRSAELTSTAWTIINLTGTSVLAPDGTNTATSFNDGAVTGEHGVYGSFSPNNRPITGAVSCTFSCFLKAGTVRYVSVNVTNFSNSVGMLVDTQTWQIVDAKSFGTGWTYTSSKLTDYGSRWYRAELTFTPPAATGVIPRISGTQSSTYSAVSPSYTGTNSTIIVWGAQLEAGSFATSYIPTTTSALARSADVCSITGANFMGMWNALEGSLFTSAIFNAPVAYGASQAIVDINDTTTANRLRYFRGSTSGFATFANTSNSTQNVSILSTVASQPFTTQKYASGFKLDDFVFYVNNSQIGSDNSGAMIVSPTTFTIGDASAGFTPRLYLNGTISAIRYYRKRLDNSKLASLTV